MIISGSTTNSGTQPVTITCPACGRAGNFESIDSKDWKVGHCWVSHRQCPHPDCRTYVLAFLTHRSPSDDAEVIECYPPQRIDFDTTGIPDGVVESFEEAITCHANNCYVASGIMVRRTLEEICDEENAEGSNLWSRIEDLRDQITVPEELLDGMHDIRLLGNDAAHIEARTYKDVGKEEVVVAIAFTKEILKAIYQYEELLSQLQSLQTDSDD